MIEQDDRGSCFSSWLEINIFSLKCLVIDALTYVVAKFMRSFGERKVGLLHDWHTPTVHVHSIECPEVGAGSLFVDTYLHNRKVRRRTFTHGRLL